MLVPTTAGSIYQRLAVKKTLLFFYKNQIQYWHVLALACKTVFGMTLQLGPCDCFAFNLDDSFVSDNSV